MLKLTMNPRKRSKRSRVLPSKLYVTTGRPMESERDVAEQREMLADNLHALLAQENSGKYDCIDYLSMTVWQHNVYQLLKKHRSEMRPYQLDARIDEYCREQIAEWSFRVVDYFRIDREVVALSLSLLDRFLATCRCDRSSFKLAATTTLHLAVKLLHPCKLGDLGILSDLSRGEFDMHDVCDMETHILRALDWNLHPPTSIAFGSLLLEFFLCDRNINMTNTDVDDLYDITSFFSELAVCDYYFVTLRSSTVALACILNALEGMYGCDNALAAHIMETAKSMQIFPSQELPVARQRLWELYERSEECALHNEDPMEEEKVNGTIFVKKISPVSTSPVTVATKPCNSMPGGQNVVCSMRPSKGMRNNGSW